MSLTLPNIALLGTVAAMSFAANATVDRTSTRDQVAHNATASWFIVAVIAIGLVYSLIVLPSRVRAGSSGTMKTYAIGAVAMYLAMLVVELLQMSWQYESAKTGRYTSAHARSISTANSAVTLIGVVGIVAMLAPGVMFSLRMHERR